MSTAIDGIICFGGVDYWYHNRGHYDPQMMRKLKQRVPVLYVNSIGMRTPQVSEGHMFARKIARKLASLFRGFTKVEERFGVLTALSLPAGGKGYIQRLNAFSLSVQVKWAAQRMGIKRPALWIACPPAVSVLPHFKECFTIYQRTDLFEAYYDVDDQMIRAYDRTAKQQADLVLFCSTKLFDAEHSQCNRAAFIDHGVDFDRFSEAGIATRPDLEPPDVRHLPRPRVGFVGGIDSNTFDPDLFRAIARQLPNHQFILVGSCSFPKGWISEPNVTLVGRKPYDSVPHYMAACDVLIMPWNQREWIEYCNPVKTKEYLAVGRPVVSTYFPEIERFRDLVSVQLTPELFAAEVARAAKEPGSAEKRRDRVETDTWSSRADLVWSEIQESLQQPYASQ